MTSFPRRRHSFVLLFLLSTLPLAGATHTVSNTNDSGPGSLRQALLDSQGGGRIEFAIGSGPQTIKPLTALPELRQSVDIMPAELVIDGRTQPGYTGTPIIEIDGSLIPTRATGLNVTNTEVYGLVINNFVTGIEAESSTVRNCYIGTDLTGTFAKPNERGILVDSYWRTSIVGGSAPGDGNLISGNRIGVTTGGPSVRASIQGNVFGTNAAQTASFPGTRTHLYAVGRLNIGDEAPNVFAGRGNGIETSNSSSGITLIHGNFFGVTPAGVAMPMDQGIRMSGDGITISGNVIANCDVAIHVSGALGNVITNNSIYGNGFGIDLSPGATDGIPTPNDPGDADKGPHNYLNFPILDPPAVASGQMTITGTLSTLPIVRTYRVELFASPSCNATGYGEGKELIDELDVTTDAAGAASFSRTLPAHPIGTVITATSTSPVEGTSEFSPCATIEGPGQFAFSVAAQTVAEGASATVTVKRLQGARGAASVTYGVNGGTASAADHSGATGTLDFANGETTKSFNVVITNDSEYEGNETLAISLSNATNGATIGSPSSHTITITDDDPPPTVTLRTVETNEGDAGQKIVEVPARLAAPLSAPYTVSYVITSDGSAAPGSDFIAESGSITFPPGQTETVVPVRILGDTVWERTERVLVNLEEQPSAQGQVVILNDDPPPVVSVENLTVVEGDAQRTVQVTLTATSPAYGEVTVQLISGSAQATTDFSPLGSHVSFDFETSKTFTFELHGDPDPEPDERFEIRLTSSSPDIRTGPNGIVTILNDDQGVGPAERWIAVGEKGTFTVALGQSAARNETIALESGVPSGVSVPATLVIPAGQSFADFDATALAPGHDAQITVRFPASLGGGTTTARARTYSRAALRFSPRSVTVVEGKTATVSVSLDPPATTPTTIGLRSSARASVPATLTIPPGGSASFVVTGKKIGAFIIDAQLPEAYGNEVQLLSGDVVVLPATPHVSNVSPSSGTTAGGTHVRVSGTSLDGTCWLFFDRFAATHVVVRDAGSLTGVAPPHATGASDVTVRCSAGTSTIPLAFTYRNENDPAPLVTEIVPAAAAPGELVTIRGSNFRPTDDAAVDTTPATIVDSSPEGHVIRVPELPAGRVSVFVSDLLGRTTTSGPVFSVLEARPPRITAVSPAQVPAGGELELFGEGFRPGYTFEIGGRPATLVTSESTRAIVRVDSAVAAGSHAVAVRNRADAIASIGPNVQIVDDGMVLTSADPRCTTTDGGIDATIRGAGFTSGVNVTFAALPASEVTVIDATTLRVQVPPGEAGFARIAVTDSSGRTATLTNGFRYASEFDPRGCGGRSRTVRH